eukprot:510189-Alexandrium_andersonii.AAC.1
MPDVGEPMYPENTSEEVGEKMMHLMNMMEAPVGPQEGPGGRSLLAVPAPEEAADFVRALLAAGATPGE